MKKIYITFFILLSFSTVFSTSSERYKKLNDVKADMLLQIHRKLMLVENIYQLNNKIANISPDGKSIINMHNSNNIDTRILEYNRIQLIDEIKKNEIELNNIEKRIQELNYSIREYVGRS